MVALKNFICRFYVGIIVFFLYVPIVVLIGLSFNASKSRAVWGGFTFKWYIEMFQNEDIMQALLNTVLLALVSAVVATIIGTLGAIGIDAMRRKEYSLVMGFTNIPMLNADIVTGVAMMLLFVRFMPLGVASVLIAHITFNIPYVILDVLPRLRSMEINTYEAARDLGAGPMTAFFKIVLPSILPGVLSGFLMAITLSMDDFVITYFTKGAGFNTLSTMIYGEQKKGIKPELYALSTLLFVIILVILLAVNFFGRDKKEKKEF